MKTLDTNDMGRRGPGRPKKQPGERVSRTLAVRVTYAEEMALRRKAKAAGVSLVDYHRSIIRKDIETGTPK